LITFEGVALGDLLACQEVSASVQQLLEELGSVPFSDLNFADDLPLIEHHLGAELGVSHRCKESLIEMLLKILPHDRLPHRELNAILS